MIAVLGWVIVAISAFCAGYAVGTGLRPWLLVASVIFFIIGIALTETAPV